jgi:hypothetical protein
VFHVKAVALNYIHIVYKTCSTTKLSFIKSMKFWVSYKLLYWADMNLYFALFSCSGNWLPLYWQNVYLFITFRSVTAIRIVHRTFWNLPILVFLTVRNAVWTCRFLSVDLQSLKGLGRLTYRGFLELFRYMVGLLGRVISPSQGL